MKQFMIFLFIFTFSLNTLNADTKGIPGNRGMEHVGFTVPNLKEAVTFFEDVIGAEVVFEIGPFKSDNDWLKEHLDVDARAQIPKIAMVRLGNGSNFEIFEYVVKDQRKNQPKNSDIGGHHIAIYVEDMSAAVKYLKEKGVKVLGEPTVMTQGANAGTTWVYFVSPWGMYFELVSYENGVAYEKTTDKRVFTPKK